MKTLTINGVPYTVSDAGEVFVYSSSPLIPIGTYDKDKKILALAEDWEKRMEDWVAHYRNGLNVETKDALQRAAELQRAT
jgi:hypothetical protein